jgi:hypothetical protein
MKMAHFKRKGPKSTRAGCLLCKPHKHQADHRQERTRNEREAQEWEEQSRIRHVPGARHYDFCPDCDGTGRCNCTDCKGKTCLLCGGTRIYD